MISRNPLVVNLLWESTLYLGLPFRMQEQGYWLYDAEIGRRRLRDLVAAGRSKDPERIIAAHLAFQRDVSRQILSIINAQIPAMPDIEQVPFAWKIYRDRPEICCNLAIQIIHEIYQGDFKDKEFLPSYENMAGRYHVSISTMRRTIRVLNQLGATQTINGKGTRILMLSGLDTGQIPDLTDPKIRPNMAYYIQSFELLAESCEGVMRMEFQSFSDIEKAELADMLESYLHTGRYVISPQSIFAFVAKHSHLQGIQDIYGKLYGLNLWGYPMAKYRKEIAGLDRDFIRFTEEAVQFLRDNDADRFSQNIYVLMQREYRIAKNILIEHGYKPEDLTGC